MELMVNLGEQAKYLLKPRQRAVWDELKYSPGYTVNGPYSRESHGEPLALRVEWHERYVAQPRVEPDPVLLPAHQMALQMVQAIKQARPEYNLEENAKWFFPRDLWEGVHPSKTTRMKIQGSGDPRRVNGKSVLEVAEERISDPSFVPYQIFKKSKLGGIMPSKESEKSDTPPSPKPRHCRGGRGR